MFAEQTVLVASPAGRRSGGLYALGTALVLVVVMTSVGLLGRSVELRAQCADPPQDLAGQHRKVEPSATRAEGSVGRDLPERVDVRRHEFQLRPLDSFEREEAAGGLYRVLEEERRRGRGWPTLVGDMDDVSSASMVHFQPSRVGNASS